jgi:hypothetical protein
MPEDTSAGLTGLDGGISQGKCGELLPFIIQLPASGESVNYFFDNKACMMFGSAV